MAVATLSLLASAGPSGAVLPGFKLVAQTARVSGYARDGRNVAVGQIEERLGHFERLLGYRVAQARVYEYEYPEELAVATGYLAGGVTFAKTGEVHTTPATRDHELVHLVAHQLGQPGPFFQEGLAVLLGDDAKYHGVPVDRWARRAHAGAPLTSLITSFDARNPGVGYALAGSFVRYLVKRHGLPRLVSFFRSAHPQSSAAAFASTYGASLDEEGARWARSL